MDIESGLLVLSLLIPLILPITLVSIYVNLRVLQKLRYERARTGPSTLVKNNKRLFVIYPSRD